MRRHVCFFRGKGDFFRKHVYKFRTIIQSISEFRPLSIQLLEDSIYCRQTYIKTLSFLNKVLCSTLKKLNGSKTKSVKTENYLSLHLGIVGILQSYYCYTEYRLLDYSLSNLLQMQRILCNWRMFSVI